MRHRDELTLTRAEVIATLDAGCDWQTAADRLRIPAGLVFMIATGIPADGSGVPQLPVPRPTVKAMTTITGLTLVALAPAVGSVPAALRSRGSVTGERDAATPAD